MAAYSYKFVRDLVPPYITKSIPDYEGSADYDGDLWVAAELYIGELEKELSRQYQYTNKLHNSDLLEWLKTREKTIYNNGPAIVEENSIPI